MSHFAGLGVNGLRPGVVRPSGGVFAVPGLGPRGLSVAGWIWGAWAPLYSMVTRRHEAWQGASVINQGSASGVEYASSLQMDGPGFPPARERLIAGVKTT